MFKKLMIIAAFAFLSPLANAGEQAQKAPAQEAEVSAMEVAPETAKEAKDQAETQAQEGAADAAAATTDATK
jgi:hypothetical protein